MSLFYGTIQEGIVIGHDEMRQLAVAILCLFPLAACTGSNQGNTGSANTPSGNTAGTGAAMAGTASKAAARQIVTRFGDQLKYVDVLAPADNVRQNIRTHYADLVTGQLLRTWLAEPKSAPGKDVSSPWPQSIKLRKITCVSVKRCEAKGYIRYVTSVEMTQGGAAEKRPITLDLLQTPAGWRITSVQIQPGASGH